MSKPAHTPEPWQQFAFGEVKDGTSDKDCERHIAKFRSPSDAARAIACVNACAGIYDPKELIQASEFALRERDQLKAERDEFKRKFELAVEAGAAVIDTNNQLVEKNDNHIQMIFLFKEQRDIITRELTLLLSRIESASPDEMGCYSLSICKPYIADMRSKITWLQPGEQAPEHSDELPFTNSHP